MAEWISVDERLPEAGEVVLCYAGNCLHAIIDRIHNKVHEVDAFGMSKAYMVARQLVTYDGKRWADEGVTHWMPLPDPPEAPR